MSHKNRDDKELDSIVHRDTDQFLTNHEIQMYQKKLIAVNVIYNGNVVF